MIVSPEGEPVPMTFVTYYRWVNFLDHQPQVGGKKLIMASFGKPTAPLDRDLLIALRQHWDRFPENEPLSYCDAPGIWECRVAMAQALDAQYHNAIKFDPEHVMFTVGGSGAIQAAFAAIHQLNPNGKFLTIFPFYPQYQVLYGGVSGNRLHHIDVTKTGFRLTEAALKESLSDISPSEISAFVFCDPCNPCGTTPGRDEWKRIAEVLKGYPEIPILLDEAYAEMCFDAPHASLMEVAPELYPRIILMRSATKGLSAAGERMAIAVAPNKKIRNLMFDFLINICLHSPKSQQVAYTYAMERLTEQKRLELAHFYKVRLEYAQREFIRLGMYLDDPLYKPNSTFYLIVDLSALKGKSMNLEAARILGKIDKVHPVLQTDQDIAYHLLFEQHLAISPLSFFGLDPSSCLLRVTCSDSIEVIQEMVKRLSVELNSPAPQFSDYQRNFAATKFPVH